MFTRATYVWNDHRTAVVSGAVAVAILSSAVTGYSLGKAPEGSPQPTTPSALVAAQVDPPPVTAATPSPRTNTQDEQATTDQQPNGPVPPQPDPPATSASDSQTDARELDVASQPEPPTLAAPPAAAAPAAEARRKITGTMKLEPSSARSVTYTPQRDPFVNFDAPQCGSKHNDVQLGTSVTVYNAAGAVIGTGAIDSTRWVELQTLSDAGSPLAELPASTTVVGMCELSFSVGDLPPSDFYGIEVAHRGKTIHSATELAAAGWRTQLTLI